MAEPNQIDRAAVFFDIDGTLTDGRDSTIPAGVAPAIARLKANGHIPIVNTGRPYGHVPRRIRELGFDSYVCGCGSCLIYEGKTLFYQQPPDEVCKRVRKLVRECHLDVVYERRDDFTADCSFSEECADIVKHLIERDDVPRRFDLNDDAFRFDKFVIWHNESSDYGRFSAEIVKDFELIRRSDTFSELVPKGCSKGTGIDRMIRMLQIDPKNTYAFGDSTNDEEMLRHAHTGVVMASGDPAMIRMADWVAPAPWEDGIRRGLEHFGLI